MRSMIFFRRQRFGFSIIEVLIALTLSLLIMVALTKAFKMIGDRINSSQAELELSADLRDVIGRMRNELSHCTASVPGVGLPTPTVNEGYLVYYEGPMTNELTSIVELADSAVTLNQDYFAQNRFGDLDDYLAFTTQVPDTDPPMIGYIPRGVLAAHEFAERVRRSAGVVPGYTAASGAELVPFYSRQSEIAYWLSPRWRSRDSAQTFEGTLEYETGTGYPQFRDGDGDLLPDRLDLHRRALLVNSDLNMTLGEIATANGSTAPAPPLDSIEVLPLLVVNAMGQHIEPLTSASINPLAPTVNSNFFSGATADYVDAPGAWDVAPGNDDPNWLVGLARVQQVMDVSISRVINTWDTPATAPGVAHATTSFGMPTRFIRANNMGLLSRPENRFAHVRMPEVLLSNTAPNFGVGSTLPQLALAPPHPFMVRHEEIRDFTNTAEINRNLPAQADPDGLAGSTAGGNDQIQDNQLTGRYGRFTMVGFLRPEFNLADRVRGPNAAPSGSNTEAMAIVSRGGSDIVATDILSFDLKAFDPGAAYYMSLGPNDFEGSPGDDDGDGVASDLTSPNNIFDPDELGFTGTDDELVNLNDLNSRWVVTSTLVAPTFGFPPIGKGAFVDLGYTQLPGHSLGGIRAITSGRLTAMELNSEFSGAVMSSTLTANAHFSGAMMRAGRFVIRQRNDISLVHSFYQSVFDTGTSNYRTGDSFDQEGLATATTGNPFSLVPLSYTIKKDDGDSDPANDLTELPVSYRNWSNMTVPSEPLPLSNDVQSTTTGFIPGSTTRIDVTPPTSSDLQALQIQVRLYNPKAGQIRQQILIHDFTE